MHLNIILTKKKADEVRQQCNKTVQLQT